ncbi:STAS domain-containing protein [Streptomyces sp. OspMP-M43]|uniref:STAS domain-containing protein n=1 Tax=Streptomyces sp. OspMP-M43 TaxID=1839781 RepID=UPI00081B3F0C|nr:STAS domain-containing protein [Streptomyces sp. OspMP-M43]SCE61136.1 anti-anti-sigma factor [Streptomyces sp. OspMP-M43]
MYHVTTELHGRSATLTPHGDIDHDSLDHLRTCLTGLPDTVAEIIWDLHAVTFVDVAGLHLLSTPTLPAQITLTSLPPQAARLLETAHATFPDQGWDRHLATPEEPQHRTPGCPKQPDTGPQA